MDTQEIKNYIEERLLQKVGCKGREYKLSEVVENTHVNFVYKVEISSAKRLVIYLKHAKDFVKRWPEKKYSLERQKYEARAAELFHKILGDKVPFVVDFDEARHILALTDIEHGQILSALFKENIFYLAAWKDLGRSIGQLHRATYAKDLWIRPPEANKAHNEYILPFRYNGALELAPASSKKHLAEAENEATCIVWADPLRKNIFQTERETFFLDFENVVRYEPAYDVGYTLAELAVESLNAEGNIEKTQQCVAEFIKGYSSEFEPADKINHILHRSVKHLAAIMLHRTCGEPGKSNRLEIKEDVRLRLVAAAVEILNSDYSSPLDIFEVIKSN
ncbi:MAG: phosphotransferase [Candidatus Woesearchaeota archaeon]